MPPYERSDTATINGVSNELLFLISPPKDDGALAYEPFPAEGEPVYATHPAFVYDKGLALGLSSYALVVGLLVKSGKPPSEVEDIGWLTGEVPIPAKRWEIIKVGREKWLAKHDHPLDTPVGFQHPDFQPSSDQSDQPKQPAPPLQAAS